MIVHSYDVEKSIQYVLELNCIKLRNIATKQRAKKYLKGCTMRKKIITSLTIITCLFSICPIAQAEEIPDLTQNYLSKETESVGDVCIYGRGVYCFSHPGTYTGNWEKIGRIKSGKWTTQITWKTNGVKYKSSKLAPGKLLIISGNVIKVEVW